MIGVEKSNGERVRGVKISLRNSMSSDEIYVTEDLLSNFQNELRQLEHTRRWAGKCRAKVRCVHGIARCRPSQFETQAYCPGRFSTSGSEEGFILSTPRNTFSFPSVSAIQFERADHQSCTSPRIEFGYWLPADNRSSDPCAKLTILILESRVLGSDGSLQGHRR